MFICLSLARMARVGHSARVQKAGKQAEHPRLLFLHCLIFMQGSLEMGLYHSVLQSCSFTKSCITTKMLQDENTRELAERGFCLLCSEKLLSGFSSAGTVDRRTIVAEHLARYPLCNPGQEAVCKERSRHGVSLPQHACPSSPSTAVRPTG